MEFFFLLFLLWLVWILGSMMEQLMDSIFPNTKGAKARRKARETDEIVLNCEECDSPIKRKNLKYKHCQNCGAELTK